MLSGGALGSLTVGLVTCYTWEHGKPHKLSRGPSQSFSADVERVMAVVSAKAIFALARLSGCGSHALASLFGFHLYHQRSAEPSYLVTGIMMQLVLQLIVTRLLLATVIVDAGFCAAPLRVFGPACTACRCGTGSWSPSCSPPLAHPSSSARSLPAQSHCRCWWSAQVSWLAWTVRALSGVPSACTGWRVQCAQLADVQHGGASVMHQQQVFHRSTDSPSACCV